PSRPSTARWRGRRWSTRPDPAPRPDATSPRARPTSRRGPARRPGTDHATRTAPMGASAVRRRPSGRERGAKRATTRRTDATGPAASACRRSALVDRAGVGGAAPDRAPQQVGPVAGTGAASLPAGLEVAGVGAASPGEGPHGRADGPGQVGDLVGRELAGGAGRLEPGPPQR